MNVLIDKLYTQHALNADEYLRLLDQMDTAGREYLVQKVSQLREMFSDNVVYMRGLIEFTNYCKQNCMYCGIRAGNNKAVRYRLSIDEILVVCEKGYNLGFRTFVLQGGEDTAYDDDSIVRLVKMIKEKYPDCAVTLSIGEKSKASYQKYYDAGADRYLLRHETAAPRLYKELHPNMSLENRMRCLYDLKDIGFQVGAGFMVGLQGQTNADYVEDLMFLQQLKPHMVGIGPFIPHKDTPLASHGAGTVETTVMMLSLIRLMLPNALLPSTTALGSIDPLGREKGLQAGANVVMPNLSPQDVREKYLLYDGKICTNDDAAKCRGCIEKRINFAGFNVDMSRGDYKTWRRRL